MQPTDEMSLSRLLARYCMSIDDGRFDDFEALWDPGARMVVMGATHEGPAAIRAFMEQAQGPEARGRHMTSNHVVIAAGEGRARGWADYIFLDRDGVVTSMGRYHDLYVRDGDGDGNGRWLFALREIVFLGREPAEAGPVELDP